MPRISYEEAEKISNKSVYFKLKNDGDSCFVQFLTDTRGEIPVYMVHEIKTPEGRIQHVNCLRNPGDSEDVCPFCKAGMEAKVAKFAVMYDVQEKQVKFFKRGNKFFNKLQGMMDRYQPFSNYVFEIVRRGVAGSMQTDYDIYPVNMNNGKFQLGPTTFIEAVPKNQIEVPELEGVMVKNMNPQQMQNYLSTGTIDTGEAQDTNPAYQPRPQRRVPAGQNNYGQDQY